MTSARRSEPRFLLPGEPIDVELCGDVGGWRAAAAPLGWRTPQAGAVAELAVAGRGGRAQALDSRARWVVAEGDACAPVRRAGYAARKWILIRDRDQPDVLVPADDVQLVRHALTAWATPSSRLRALRSHAAVGLVRLGLVPPGLPVVTVGAEAGAVSFLLEAAIGLGAPMGSRGYHGLGGADERRRGILLVFPPGEGAPSHVLKHARYPAADDGRAATEQRLLELLSRIVPAGSVPSQIGRGRAGSLSASLETAMPGVRLTALLRGPARRSSKRALLDALASWLLQVAVKTAGRSAEGVHVLAHNDLWAGNNVLVAGGAVRVVDWEAASERSRPFYDLLSALAGSWSELDSASGSTTGYHLVRLLSGQSPDSPWLFAHVHRMAEALGVGQAQVVRDVAETWQDLDQAGQDHEAGLEAAGLQRTGWRHPAADVVVAWPSQPGLGPKWTAYMAWLGGT